MPPSVFDLIELRSFSSLWYWVLVALTWARVTQSPLGIPYDLAERVRASEQASADFLAFAGVQVRRYNATARRLGAVQVGAWAFVLTVLVGLSFAYGSELALSVLLLALPLSIVQVMNLRAARDLARSGPELDVVLPSLRRLKRRVQAIALLAVFLSAVIGMYHNLARAAF